MHRLFVAAVLGVSLLAGGGMMDVASARPGGGLADSYPTHRPAMVTPVHEYRPPPLHWRQPTPRWDHHSHYERYDG
jgi:hypothetical protein